MAKTDSSRTASIAVLAFPGCSAWITAGLVELFAIANNARATLPQQRSVAAPPVRFECHVIGNSRRAIVASHGIAFVLQPMRRRYDVLIVPPIWCESLPDLAERARKLAPQAEFVNRVARRCRIVASACSGAVLLAQAGLLTQHRATTCWWLVEWFRRTFPEVEIVPDRLVMRDGARWTAAAGSAYMHLALDLVRELAGEKLAAATARLMLVERRRGSQSPFLAPQQPAPGNSDAQVQRVARYLQQHAGQRLAIADACRALSISERTLARRFRADLGMSPLSYLQSQRIARAKQLLESSALPLERIVEQCGYEDLSSFRKLFARHVGMTPREYRSRFSGRER